MTDTATRSVQDSSTNSSMRTEFGRKWIAELDRMGRKPTPPHTAGTTAAEIPSINGCVSCQRPCATPPSQWLESLSMLWVWFKIKTHLARERHSHWTNMYRKEIPVGAVMRKAVSKKSAVCLH